MKRGAGGEEAVAPFVVRNARIPEARAGSSGVVGSPHRTLAVGTVVGRYEVTREIGRGATGAVYAALDPELGRVVAVKLLRGGGRRVLARLRRDAKAIAGLAHPGLVAVYDVGSFGDGAFVAMEYVDGEPLARWLATPRPPREILDVFARAGRGLAAAHAAGIAHGGFTPENVLLGVDGRVCVADLGLAHVVGARASDPEVPGLARGSTRMVVSGGAAVGARYGVAPELYRGYDPDARSDQFSFCVALFAALYGRRPFAPVPGESLDALVANLGAGRLRTVPAVPGVSRRVRTAILRGLAAERSARFASLDQLVDRLAPRSGARVVVRVGLAVAALAATGWLVAHSH